jgi:ABC-type glycerol-3-phosphate transport system substrate-binding protein
MQHGSINKIGGIEMRHRLMRILLLLVLLCGTLGSSQALARTKITLWTFSGGVEAYQKAHESLLPEFAKAFPDVDLEISYIPNTKEKFLVAYAAGAAPDIISLRTADQASLIELGMVAPVNPTAFGANSKAELERILLPGTVQTLTYRDGQFYFMPTEISVFGLFVNNDIFAQSGVAGVPKTWEELMAMGKKLTRTNSTGQYEQIALYIPRGWIWSSFTFPTLMYGYGVQPLSADGKPQFSHPDAIQALNLYPEMWRTLADPVGSVANHWQQGKAALYWGANYQITTFENANYVFDWSSAPMPSFAAGQPSTVSYALGHFVNSQSQNQQLAWEVVAFFTGPKTAEHWYTSVALWHPWRGAWLDNLFKLAPRHQPFLESLEYSIPEISHPKVAEIRAKLGEAETRIYKGEQSVEAAMRQLDEELNVLFASE